MKTPLVLALLTFSVLAPLAAADHAALCGAPDGSVVDGVYAWLRPGCLGVAIALPPESCDPADPPLWHLQVEGVWSYSDGCVTGVWLP